MESKGDSVRKLQPVNVVFGIPLSILPMKGFPEGKIRLRLRHECFSEVFVKTNDGIRQFYLEEKEGCWVFNPDLEVARNYRPPV